MKLPVFLLLLLLLLWEGNVVDAQKSGTGGGSKSDDRGVMRPYHLDYLDAPTMEYYLQAPRHDYDLAVLFYAQWDENSHLLAPYWDDISRSHQAGTEASNLIMGLFDCEENARHIELCTQAGVRHYPTLTFFSLSGQGLNAFRKPHHASQFGGDWRYQGAVYDWLRTLSGLSTWHRMGWGKKLRSMFFGKRSQQTPKDRKLPLGIPSGGAPLQSSLRDSNKGATTSSASASSTDAKIVEALEARVKEYRELMDRSAIFLDAALFPLSTGEYNVKHDTTKNTTDVFALLDATSGWTSTQNVDVILKTCTMEISLDYCSRLSDYLANEWVNQQSSLGGLESITDEVVEAFTKDIAEAIQQREPYCALVEECILTDYTKDECKPSQCPFVDPIACRYLSACLDNNLQQEYATALNLTDTGSSTTEPEAAAGDGTKPKGMWGM